MFESGWEYVVFEVNVFWFWVDEMKIDQERYKIVSEDVLKLVRIWMRNRTFIERLYLLWKDEWVCVCEVFVIPRKSEIW